MNIIDMIRKVWYGLTSRNSEQKVLSKNGAIIESFSKMYANIELWKQMYLNRSPWLNSDIKSLNLASSISDEFTRLILTEFNFSVSGSTMAEFINKQLENLIISLNDIMEQYTAFGGIILKPFVKKINDSYVVDIDIVKPDRFFPISYSNKNIDSAIFIYTINKNDYMYTRLEKHEFNSDGYTITNQAFRSELKVTPTSKVNNRFKERVSLELINDWSMIQDTVTIGNISQPLFVYIRVPKNNTIDLDSPLGASVFARATDLIKEADYQYSRILWEYKSTELAVFADESMFKTDRQGNPLLPGGAERLFKTFEGNGNSSNGLMLDVFSPEIRDTSLFNGLNQILRRIEFTVGLSYGTLSDVSNVERTATEIISSKQRSYNSVFLMQKNLEIGLRNLVTAIKHLCLLYGLEKDGDCEITCTFGDGILEDSDKEYQRRWQMVLSGKLRIEKFYAWYFGCSEEEAATFVPDQEIFPELE